MKKIFTLFFVPSLAFALCPSFSDLKINVEICEDNFILGKKADACLDRISKEISGVKPIVEQALVKNSQNNSFQSASNVYSKAISELDRLILQGIASKAAVDSYLAQIYMPEDYDKPSLTGMSTAEYLKKEPCYGVPHKVMSEDSEVIQILVMDLKKKKEAILALRNSTEASEKNLDNGNNSPMIGGVKKEVTPKANPAASKSGSSISGNITDGKSKKVQEQEQK